MLESPLSLRAKNIYNHAQQAPRVELSRASRQKALDWAWGEAPRKALSEPRRWRALKLRAGLLK